MDLLPVSTLDGLESESGDRVAVWARRAFLVVLAIVVAAGLTGLLGVRTSEAGRSEGGW